MQSTDKQFQSMADSIVEDFFSGDKTLNDLVAEEAVKSELKPEEIKRLVEKTNTSAAVSFLSSNVKDKKSSFDLADIDSVLEKTHPIEDVDVDDDEEEPELTKQAYYTESYKDKYLNRAVSMCDKAFSVGTKKLNKTASDKNNGYSEYLTLRKYIDLAKQEKTAEEISAREDIDFLISDFDKWQGPDFNKFASEAYAVYGKKCLPVINGVATYLGETKKMYKVAYAVDDTTVQFSKLASAIKHLENIIVLNNGISCMENAATYYKNELCK